MSTGRKCYLWVVGVFARMSPGRKCVVDVESKKNFCPSSTSNFHSKLHGPCAGLTWGFPADDNMNPPPPRHAAGFYLSRMRVRLC